MCGPAVAIPLAIASTVVTAGAQLYSGASQKAQANYEAAIAKQNRNVELRARDDAAQRGELEQMRHWRRVSQAIGEQTARQAASGVDVNFGSAKDLLSDVQLIGGEDAQILAENTVREMRGYEVNAANYVMQGRAAKARGKASMIGGALSAFSTILGGASQVSGMRSSAATASIGS